MNIETKVVYETKWRAKDQTKEYPHGWGFDAPLVIFDQSKDPAECSEICKTLSDDEFECIGTIPRKLLIMSAYIQVRDVYEQLEKE